MAAKQLWIKGASLAALMVTSAAISSPLLAAEPSAAAPGASAERQTEISRAQTQITQIMDREWASLDAIYRDLHANPELGLQEVRTAAILAKELKKSGFTVTEKVGGTGVVGVLKNGDGPTILVRADMDGLPMEEKTDLAWASKVRTPYEGRDVPVMHACGHDIHVTWLIGMARTLSAMKDQWKGTLVFIGQPAEETLKGAKAMLADGLLTRFPRPDFGFAAHVGPFPAGLVAMKSGPSMASTDAYTITFHGRGGHGSAPAATIDPIPIAARFVTDVQTVVSREKDPAAFGVITVGAFQAGSASNIIPDQAELKVNLRAHNDEVREKLNEGTKRTAIAAAQMGAAPAPTITYLQGTGVLMNDPSMTKAAYDVLKPIIGPQAHFQDERETPVSGSEDYSEFVQAGIPSVFFWIGGYEVAKLAALKERGEPVPTNHSPFFAPSAEPSVRAAVSAITLSIIGGVRPTSTAATKP
jgi:amidohydrolase